MKATQRPDYLLSKRYAEQAYLFEAGRIVTIRGARLESEHYKKAAKAFKKLKARQRNFFEGRGK